jgi:hypothetical protein
MSWTAQVSYFAHRSDSHDRKPNVWLTGQMSPLGWLLTKTRTDTAARATDERKLRQAWIVCRASLYVAKMTGFVVMKRETILVREIPSARAVKRAIVVVSVIAGFVFSICAQVGAQQAASDHPYSGDIFTRSTLTGDWDGYRNNLEAMGITFDLNVTQIEQGVVDGGKSGAWEYGGRGDLTGHLDTQELGLWPGGFLTIELEGDWSHSVNGNTGALLPANTSQLFPLPGGRTWLFRIYPTRNSSRITLVCLPASFRRSRPAI